MTLKTGLKRLSDGTFSITSDQGVQTAIEAVGELEYKIAELTIDYQTELGNLKEAINNYVLDNQEVETDTVKLTRVQSHSRKWNYDKLKKIVPKGIFLQLCDLVPSSDKIDQMVRAGKLDRSKIAPAFEETPNKAYVKWTPKKADTSERADAQAAALKV